MATNNDSFTITAAMLTMAYVKPATVYTTVAGGSNASDNYLPRTLATKAGCPGGTGAAIAGEANYTFAITAEGPAVDTNNTLVIATVV